MLVAESKSWLSLALDQHYFFTRRRFKNPGQVDDEIMSWLLRARVVLQDDSYGFLYKLVWRQVTSDKIIRSDIPEEKDRLLQSILGVGFTSEESEAEFLGVLLTSFPTKNALEFFDRRIQELSANLPSEVITGLIEMRELK